MRKNSTIPHISTRGYYDLNTGAVLRKGLRYFIFPKNYFNSQRVPIPEIVLMIHGMQNDRAGATAKFIIAKKRLRLLGYKFPVIGYTYDANVRGVHSAKTEAHALCVANMIAKKNGKHLAMFISDIHHTWPKMRIRLIGHSLGSVVIASAFRRLALLNSGKNIVQSVHMFGASLQLDDATSPQMRKALGCVISGKVLNCYSPKDEVLKYSVNQTMIKSPIGLYGIAPRARLPHYVQRVLHARNHRFASYIAALGSFP